MYIFQCKQQEVGERIAELEQRMAQYGDVEPATEADVSGKLENLQRLMGQFSMPEDGEFSEEEMDKYVSGVANALRGFLHFFIIKDTEWVSLKCM